MPVGQWAARAIRLKVAHDDDPGGVYRAVLRTPPARRPGCAVLTRLVALRCSPSCAAGPRRRGSVAGVAAARLAAAASLAAFEVLVIWHGRLARRHRHAVIAAGRRGALLRLARELGEPPQRPHGRRRCRRPPYAATRRDRPGLAPPPARPRPPRPVGAVGAGGWLLAPAEPAVVAPAPGRIAELAPLLDLREELQVLGRRVGRHPTRAVPALGRGGRLPRGWRAMLRGPGWPALARSWPAVLAHVLTLPLWVLVLAVDAAVGLSLGARVEAVLGRCGRTRARCRVREPARRADRWRGWTTAGSASCRRRLGRRPAGRPPAPAPWTPSSASRFPRPRCSTCCSSRSSLERACWRRWKRGGAGRLRAELDGGAGRAGRRWPRLAGLATPTPAGRSPTWTPAPTGWRRPGSGTR